MKIERILIIIICVTTLWGCNKEINSDIDIVPSLGNDSNYYLERIIDIDTSAGFNDTVRVVKYEYDNLNRVTKFMDTLDDDLTQYYYQGSSKLPYRSTNIAIPPNTGATSENIYTYNSQGTLVTDSFHIPSDTGTIANNTKSFTVTKYVYASAFIAIEKKYVYFEPVSHTTTVHTEKDTTQIDAAGNLTAYNKYYTGTLDFSANITYNNYKSPFAHLNILQNLEKMIGFESSYSHYFVYQVNNFTYWKEKKYNYGFGYVQTEHYQTNFVYNNNNLPSYCLNKVVADNAVSGTSVFSTNYYKRYFTYKKF